MHVLFWKRSRRRRIDINAVYKSVAFSLFSWFFLLFLSFSYCFFFFGLQADVSFLLYFQVCIDKNFFLIFLFLFIFSSLCLCSSMVVVYGCCMLIKFHVHNLVFHTHTHTLCFVSLCLSFNTVILTSVTGFYFLIFYFLILSSNFLIFFF